MERLTILLMLCSVGCALMPSDEPVVQLLPLPNRAVRISPYPPQQGKSITIEYDQTDSTAAYRTATRLIAQIITKRYSVHYSTYVLPLERRESSLLSATCTLPDDAYFIDIQVRELDETIPKELPLSLSVFKGNEPALGAIPELLLRNISDSNDEVMNDVLFMQDATVYPDHSWRWLPKWMSTIGRERKPTAILPDVDALWKVEAARQTVSGAAVCMTGFAMCKQWDRAAECARLLAMRLASDTNTVPLSLLSTAYHTSRRILRAAAFDDSEHERRFKQMLDMLAERFPYEVEARTLVVERQIQAASRTLSTSGRKMKWQTQQGDDVAEEDKTLHRIAASWCQWLLAPTQNPDIACIKVSDAAVASHVLLSELRDTSTALRLIEKMLEKLPSIASHMDVPGCGTPVTVNKEGTIPSLLLDKANILLARNAPSGIATAHQLLYEYPIEQYSIGPISLAAVALTDYHIRMHQIDSALKYWAWTSQLESPYSDSLWSRLRRIATSKGIRVPNRSNIVAQYPYLRGRIYRTTSILAFELEDGRRLDPRTEQNPVLLLFTSETCGLCKMWYPRLLDSIARQSLPTTTIVIRPDQSTIAVPAIIELSHAQLTPELSQAYSVRGFPTVVLIADGKIQYNSGCSSAQQVRTILDILRRTAHSAR